MNAEMAKQNKIKVSIVDDEKAYRDFLKETLKKDQRIILYGEYKSGQEFVRALNSPFQPDVCLIDIVLKDMSGIECGKIIKEKNPDIHVIFMTAYPEVKTLAEAKKINADYIEKKTRGEILINTIITTVKNMRKERLIFLYDDQALTDNALELADVLAEAQKSVLTLSDTQRQVLELKKKDKSDAEIAEILGIKTDTVRTHVSRAFRKLNLPKLLKYLDL